MTPLNVLRVSTAPEFTEFATEQRPLRPSKTSRFLGCPMSSVLTQSFHDGYSGDAAQTGNLVHTAAAEFHRNHDVQGALDAMTADRAKFPDGDAEKAEKIFRSYVGDPRNSGADVIEVEKGVRLILEPANDDPTGKPIYIVGTLDQVRKDATGRLTIHDIKTGSRLNPGETVAEYLVQQAAYLLAARQDLGLDVTRATLIWTPAYEKTRGNPFLLMNLTVKSAETLMSGVVSLVSLIRRGHPIFRPGEPCKYCPLKSYADCFANAKGIM